MSHTIVNGGGVVRGIANHGIRDFPHRIQARYADKEGNRYYRKGRFLSIYYDSNPTVMQHVDHMLAMDDQVLRTTHLKARSTPLDGSTIAKPEHNPYVQRILQQQRRQQQREQALQYQKKQTQQQEPSSPKSNDEDDGDDEEEEDAEDNTTKESS